MFDPKMKYLSFHQFFILPAIALLLVTSPAIAQDAELEEIPKEESASITASQAEMSNAQKDLAGSSPGGQSSETPLVLQANMGASAAGQVEDGSPKNARNEPLSEMATSLIPHVTIFSGLVVGLALIRFFLRWLELVHKEHLLAIEKGLLKFQINQKRLVLWGMVWVSLGIAAGVALWVNFDWMNAVWSLMPLLLGIVLLVYVGITGKKRSGAQSAQEVSSVT
ncbi:MAG: hypothetical protein ACE5FY_01375 [Nitrospiria bacterium]